MKEYVLSKTAKNDLLQIDVTTNKENIVWESDDEFTLQGKMYDIVNKEIVNGKQIIYCVDDEKETELIVKYNNEHKKNKDSKTSNIQFSIVFCEVIPAFIFPTFAATTPNVFFTSNLFLAEKKATSPPPKYGSFILLS